MAVTFINADCLDALRTLPDASVHCCVTSPPYFGLRDYGVAGQIGLEPTPDEFVAKLVDVFREVRRVLRDDGTLWLNLGDSYAADTRGSSGKGEKQISNKGTLLADRKWAVPEGLKRKDLIGIPWRVAFALQSDGWYLRQDIIWSKPNPMPESVRDRCTKAHEYIFMLSKSERYYFDAAAIKEPAVAREAGEMDGGAQRLPSGANANDGRNFRKQDGTGNRRYTGFNDRYFGKPAPFTRNKRSVWTVTTKPFKEAHFATFPPDLIEPCILAGCPSGGTVLDPFGGAGTTGLVSERHGRNSILIEINREYIEIAKSRIEGESLPLLAL